MSETFPVYTSITHIIKPCLSFQLHQFPSRLLVLNIWTLNRYFPGYDVNQLLNMISASEYRQSVTGDINFNGRIYPVIYALAGITSSRHAPVTTDRILNVALPHGISFITNRLTHI
jgi:hypothetical protein